MSHPKPYKDGSWLVICDSCGAQRYRSECDFTWDGYLMCHTRGCWYPKHAIFEVIPVIADPEPIFETRPDQAASAITLVDDQVGLITTFDNYHRQFGGTGKKFGEIDSPPDYWS